MVSLTQYFCLDRLVQRLLAAWPDHAKYIQRRFGDDDPEFLARSEEVAALIMKLLGEAIDEYCQDYIWMSTNFNEEQLYFLRNKRYRFSDFASVFANVYGNDAYMSRYVHGILLSQIFWKNHARSIDYFRCHFLATAPAGFNHLEVGPGHGLFLYFAACHPRAGTVTAWELSNASIAATRTCLEKFGVSDRVDLIQSDVLKVEGRREAFDTILMSEVLEHLERPDAALETLRLSLKPDGRLLVNIPINSPAPDHIYLWSSPDEVSAFVRGGGFEITEAQYFPVTGYTLEAALTRRLGVSCLLTCRKAG